MCSSLLPGKVKQPTVGSALVQGTDSMLDRLCSKQTREVQLSLCCIQARFEPNNAGKRPAGGQQPPQVRGGRGCPGRRQKIHNLSLLAE